MKKNFILSIGLFVIFSFLFSSLVLANNDQPMSMGSEASIREKKLLLRDEDVEIRGTLPVLERMKNVRLQNEVNIGIQDVYDQKVSAAKISRVKQLIFDHDYKYGSDVTTILLMTTYTSSSSKTEVNSFNFNEKTNRMVTISDILGPNGVSLAGRYISGLTKKEPDKYNPNFKGLSSNQAFYVEDGSIVFMFDEFQIAGGSAGVVKFPMVISQVANHALDKNEYFTKDDYYGLKMIPLRAVCEGLGYTVRWNAVTKSTDIRKDGQFITSVTLNENRYSKDSLAGRTVRTLESAPELVKGVTYVPISFFDVILDMTYGTDAKGVVTFSIYHEALVKEIR